MWILYIIGGLILLGLIIGIIGRLGRFPWLTLLVAIVVCIAVTCASSIIWGLIAGFLSIGLVQYCKEQVDK